MEEVTQTVETEKEVTGKTVISFTAPTPKWATWVFRTEFVINKALLMVLSGTSLLSPQQVKESLIWIAAIDFMVWGIGRGLGVQKSQFDETQQS